MRLHCADASTLALLRDQPNAHGDRVLSVGFSPDGTRIVSGSVDGSIGLWGGRPSLALSCSVLSWGIIRGIFCASMGSG